VDEENKDQFESSASIADNQNALFSLQIRDLTIEDYAELADKIKKGEIFININATALLFKVFVKILEQINQDLINIASEKGRFTQVSVRKFAVSYSYLRMVDMLVFAAFVAPKNDIWF